MVFEKDFQKNGVFLKIQ